MTDLFRACADAYWNRGYSVVPVQLGTKQTFIPGWTGHCNGPPGAKIRDEWMAKYANYGIGLLLNTEIVPRWRIAAVDVDDDQFVDVTRAVLGEVVSGKRGKKGATFFAKVEQSAPVQSTTLTDHQRAGKIDLLVNGKMTVIPPTQHPETRVPYEWLGMPLLECDPLDLPRLTQEKVDLLRLIVRSEDTSVLISGQSTHSAGVSMAWRLVEFGCSDSEATGIIVALLPREYGGNSLDELQGWVESARRKLGAASDRRPLDEEIALAIENILRPLAFVPGEGFRRYTEGYWPQVSDRDIDRQAKTLLSTRLKPHQQISSYLSNVRRCLELTCERPGFGGASRFMIGLSDGAFNVERGVPEAHAPEHELRYRLDFGFDPEAQCPLYEQQLERTFRGNRLAMNLFDEFAGLTLVPDMRYQKAVFLVGAAGSGKSTLLRVLESMHDPDAVSVTPLDHLDSERYLTNLALKLVCISFDTQSTKTIFGEAFMRITGGDPVAIRKLYKEVQGRVTPTVRLIGSMNFDIPRAIGAGDALRRRLIFLMCGDKVEIPDPDRDSKLRAERPGIFLRWMLALDRLNRRTHFEIPQESLDEVMDYTTSQEPVALFVNDCLRVDLNARLAISNITQAFNSWAEEHAERNITANVLGRKLRALGFKGGYENVGIGAERKNFRVMYAALRQNRPKY